MNYWREVNRYNKAKEGGLFEAMDKALMRRNELLTVWPSGSVIVQQDGEFFTVSVYDAPPKQYFDPLNGIGEGCPVIIR